MNRTFKILLAAALIGSAASPAFAIGCYERQYSASHLARNPHQAIRSIMLNTETGDAPAQLQPGEFEMRLTVLNRRTSQWHDRNAVCAAREGRINCGLESDGGTFTISQGQGRTVILRPQGELRVGGEENLFEFGGRISDDNAFIMHPSACERGS
jgi:hypothetical protein